MAVTPIKIEVRLFATLRHKRDKVSVLKIEPNFILGDVLDMLQIKPEDVALFLINGRNADLNTPLTEGDVLSLFPPVGGG